MSRVVSGEACKRGFWVLAGWVTGAAAGYPVLQCCSVGVLEGLRDEDNEDADGSLSLEAEQANPQRHVHLCGGGVERRQAGDGRGDRGDWAWRRDDGRRGGVPGYRRAVRSGGRRARPVGEREDLERLVAAKADRQTGAYDAGDLGYRQCAVGHQRQGRGDAGVQAARGILRRRSRVHRWGILRGREGVGRSRPRDGGERFHGGKSGEDEDRGRFDQRGRGARPRGAGRGRAGCRPHGGRERGIPLLRGRADRSEDGAV